MDGNVEACICDVADVWALLDVGVGVDDTCLRAGGCDEGGGIDRADVAKVMPVVACGCCGGPLGDVNDG